VDRNWPQISINDFGERQLSETGKDKDRQGSSLSLRMMRPGRKCSKIRKAQFGSWAQVLIREH
jgi:hypothetical protein